MKRVNKLSIKFFFILWVIFISFSLLFIPIQSAAVFGYSPTANNIMEKKSRDLTVTSSATTPSTTKGQIATSEYGIFWFIHITDTQSMYQPDKLIKDREQWFFDFANETVNTIEPKFVLNTGDLVNSDYHGFFNKHTGQIPYEWNTYNQILTSAGMNKSNYYDVMGNHDVYEDEGFTWYLNGSIQQQLYYDFEFDLSALGTTKNYHFIGLHTPEDHGAKYPFSLFGYLNNSELDWYEKKLIENNDADLTVIFGHHPAYEIAEGGSRFFQLNQKYGVDLYLVGHGHDNNQEMINNEMVSIETAKLSDAKDCYRIMVVDDDIISSSVQTKYQWPVGVISSPSDYQNIYADMTATKITQLDEIHVMTWSPKEIKSVEWRYMKEEDNEDSWSDWNSMTNKGSALYIADIDSQTKANLMDGDEHFIQTNITDSSSSKIETIEYKMEKKFMWGWYYGRPLITIGIIFVFIGMPATKAIMRKKEKFRAKRDEEKVDPKIAKLIIIKLCILLFVPLLFAEIWANEVVAIFSTFFWRTSGILWSDTNMFLTAGLVILGIIIPLFNLSPQKRYWMVLIVLPLDIGVIILFLYFYCKVFTLISLLAPGYYLLIGCDMLLYKRELEIINNRRNGKKGLN
jgi:predicted phosphodiesterase